MRSECWNCGKVLEFDDMEEFVENEWCSIGVGNAGRYGSMDSGSKRDFCSNCRSEISLHKQIELISYEA